MTENDWEARAIAAEQRLAAAEQHLAILRGTVTQDAALIAQLMGAKQATEQERDAAMRAAEEAVAAWHKENDLRHDAEEAKEAAEATIASLSEALTGARSTSRGYPCWCDASHNVMEHEHQPKCRAASDALASLPSSPVSPREEER